MNLGILRQVKIEEVEVVGERGRKEMGDIENLAASIHTNGLIHPIAVYALNGQPPYRLVAGERRLRACQSLKWPEISVRIYDREMTEAELYAVELFENLKRKSLTYIEECDMQTQLHDVLLKLEGRKIERSPDAQGHSLRKLARTLGESVGTLSQNMKLSRANKALPQLELGKQPNKATAMNNLKRFGHGVENRMMINEVQKKIANKPKAQVEHETVLFSSYQIGNFLEAANDLEPEQFSLIEMDPPYGINLAEAVKASDTLRHEYDYVEVSPELYRGFIQAAISTCYKLATENAWIIVWYAPEWYSTVFQCLKKAGFEPCIVPALWKKGNSNGQTYSPSTNLGNSCEFFLYARKGAVQLRNRGRSNIFDYDTVAPAQKIHPTEKPKELMREILTTFGWPKSRVLVPFAGSGTTIRQAYENDMTALGYDLSREFREAYMASILRNGK